MKSQQPLLYDLQGGIPPLWASMPQLTNVTCKSCGLSGSVPPGWLQTLQQFAVPYNAISGTLNMPVGVPSRLQALDLSYNQLDQIPPDTFWSSLPRLQILSLQANHLSGPLSGAAQRSSRHGCDYIFPMGVNDA
jgi:Leucine-rich repeat (LRR) protein